MSRDHVASDKGDRRPVLVTGASRGIGLECALTLTANGFDVWAGVRSQVDGDRVIAEGAARNARLNTVLLDVTSDQSIESAMSTIDEKSGPLYGLVNNAGITARAAFEEFPEEEIRHIFEVNVFGTMRVTQRALSSMRRRGSGKVILVTSIGGKIGAPSVAPYNSSKFALEGLGEALYLEMKPFGIDVTIIEPGIVKTDIWNDRVLPVAQNEASPYHKYFWAGEKIVEETLKTARLTPVDVARQVVHVMTVEKPKLRYVVGRRAALVLSLRRHLPGDLFERLYFGEHLRRIMAKAASGGH